MHPTMKKAAPLAVLTLAAATLTGCVLAPAPYEGGGSYYEGGAYYSQPAPVYVTPGYRYGSRYRWHHNRWHGRRDWD